MPFFAKDPTHYIGVMVVSDGPDTFVRSCSDVPPMDEWLPGVPAYSLAPGAVIGAWAGQDAYQAAVLERATPHGLHVIRQRDRDGIVARHKISWGRPGADAWNDPGVWFSVEVRREQRDPAPDPVMIGHAVTEPV